MTNKSGMYVQEVLLVSVDDFDDDNDDDDDSFLEGFGSQKGVDVEVEFDNRNLLSVNQLLDSVCDSFLVCI